MEITIRHGARADVPLIGSIWLEHYLKQPGTDRSRLHPGARVRVEQWVRDRVRNRASMAYVAEIDGAIAGFLLGRMGIWESVPPVLKPTRRAEIEALFVVAGHRRCGVATALVGQATRHARSAGASGIETGFEDDDLPARALWTSLSFATRWSRAHRALDAMPD